MATQLPAKRDQWATRIGVILAVAGSAVGLGNFLRFPGQAAQNGGGAFMLPYFISLLILGIPLCWAEWTMGRYGGMKGFNSAPGIYRTVGRSPLAMYFGAVALLLPLIIYMYYVLIEAWCLGYAINYLTGDLVVGGEGRIDNIMAQAQNAADEPLSRSEAASAAFGTFFERFVGSTENGALLKEKNQLWLFVLIGTFVFNFVLIYRGVAKGIEVFCRIAMPLMVVLAIIVLIRVLTLGTPDPTQPDRNVINGLGAMWNPTSEHLWNPQTWLAASGQIFFSLSVGFGIIINYSSYLREKDDVVLSGLTSSSMNEFFEVCLGGLITLPAAFIFLGPAATGFGTFGLGFVALPNVFGQMPGGQFFGCLWFFMLFIAAITSSVSMLQPVIAFLEEGFGLKRHASAALLGLIAAMGCGFVMYFSEGLVAMDTFDFWVGTFLIYVLAMFQAALYGWVFGIKRGEVEAHKGAHIRIPRFVQWMLKFVVPVYLVVIFAAFCWEKLPSGQTPAFDLPADTADAFAAGNLDAVRQSFASQGKELGEAATITSDGPRGRWTILASSDPDATEDEYMPLYVANIAQRSEAVSVRPVNADRFQFAPATSGTIRGTLAEGAVPELLREELAAQGVEIPAEADVETNDDQGWNIVNADGDVLATLSVVSLDEPVDVVAVHDYAMGYVETISRNPVVLSSVAFIGLVLVFLLLMVHIAGRRWEAEGRFNTVESEASTSASAEGTA